jgi:glycosyltransferase involved in cell wall biosynthesis
VRVIKILYVSTVSGTINAFLLPHIQMLIDLGHKVDIACNISSPINKVLLDCGCKTFEIEFNRSPLSKNNLIAYKKLKKLIYDEKYAIVHTHTPVASAIVRLVCKNFKNVKVFYTAHGFHFFKGAPIKNWLIYYPIERWLSRYTDVLITINKEDYQRAKKSFKAGRIEYIPGVGLDTKKFTNVTIDKFAKRKELDLPEDSFVVLSVGELNKNKNHETVIKALAKLNNPQIHYVICGKGLLKDYLESLVKELGLKKQVHLLGFRTDIAEICNASDLFAFPSHREGLGMAALEAMACGLPIVTSNVHGIVDYSVDGKTGFTCSPTDVNGFATAIIKIYREAKLSEKFKGYNIDKIKMFSIDKVKDKMAQVYNHC